MNEPGRETDLSRIRPGYRARILNPLKAIGKHRRLPHLRRARQGAEIPASRVTDLTQLPEGNPSSRADPEFLRISARARPLRGEIYWEIETSSRSPQGAAMTVIMLLGAGALLGGCGLLVAHMWRLPFGPSAIISSLLLALPLIVYYFLRPRA